MVVDITPETEADQRRQVRIGHDQEKRASDDEEIGFSDGGSKKGGRGQHREEAIEIDLQEEAALPSGLNEGEQTEKGERDWKKYLKEGKSGVDEASIGDLLRDKIKLNPEEPSADESAEIPEKLMVLTLNQEKLDKYADGLGREIVAKFLSLWGPKVTSISINGAKEGDGVVLRTFGVTADIDGSKQTAYMPATFLEGLFEKCEYKLRKGKIIGIKFFYPDETFQFVALESNPDQAKDILSRVSINGIRLPAKDKFSIEFKLPKK
jgi:hypothetical protein